MDPEIIIKDVDIQKIASEGALIYQAIKYEYEPAENGNFLAIDIDSKDVYLASTSAEAVVKAKKIHPDKIFYVVKIGFTAAETLSRLYNPK